MKTLILLFAAPFALFAAACAPNEADGADPQKLCRSICSRTYACDNTTSVSTCTNDCMDDDAATVSKLRVDVADDIESCFSQTDCATILGGNDVLSACMNSASAARGPDKKADALCSDEQAMAQQCGQSLDYASCLDAAKIFSDPALEAADACTSMACDAVSACVGAALGEASM